MYTVATINNIEMYLFFAINVFIFSTYIYIYIYIYVDIYTEIELFKHKIVLFLMFWETSILFSIEAGPIYIPTNRVHINTVYNKTRHGSNPSSHQQTN